jgi:1-acyl-sn-glycerol-3-phosphate acyltransferase
VASQAKTDRRRIDPANENFMNAWVLLSLAILLLYLPRTLSSSRPGHSAKRPKPEIHGWLRPMHWIMIAYCALLHRLKTNGWAPLPETGPAILIANHTCGIDHVILQAGCRRVLGFMVAREYYEWSKIHFFCKLVRCIPVDRDGRDLRATRAALRALEEGRVLPIFPEGRVTPSSGRELGEIRPGAAFIAVRAGVPVIPAYIRGTPETDQIGESLITPSRAEITFGSAIDLSDFNRHQAGDKAVQAEVSRRFREAFLELQARGRGAHRVAERPEPAQVV